MQTCDKNDFSDNSLLLSSRQINLTVGKRISFCESSSETHCDCHTNVGRAGHRGDKVAHRQLCAVIVLCAIFMVVEIIGKRQVCIFCVPVCFVAYLYVLSCTCMFCHVTLLRSVFYVIAPNLTYIAVFCTYFTFMYIYKHIG